LPCITTWDDSRNRNRPTDSAEEAKIGIEGTVPINAPTGDSNFEVTGVQDCVAAALPVYERIFHAPGRLIAVHPEAKHDFPPEVRRQAYAFLDQWLQLH
jgi:hypothetical protein